MHSIAPAVDPVQTEVEMDAEVAQLSSPTTATSTPKMSTASSTTANIGTSITIQSEDTLTTAPPTLPQQQQPQANTTDILDVTNEDDFLFYMNGTPQQDSGLPSKKNNSELASDDSEDDLDHEDRKMKPLSGQHHSNSSLATVQESAIEKPVRLAMILPGAVISDGRQGVNDESQGDVKTEVFMDRDGLGDNNANSTDASASKPCDIDASKDMLTEGQAFAYVGLCLVTANTLFQALEGKETAHAKESLESFVSKLINRLYKHLEIDANTQRTIAQLPQMMIQPEDLLETFVADGTQRVVSAQQVDQAGLSSTSSSSAPNSPTITGHRRHLSNASQSSLSQVYLPPQPESNLASGNESGTGNSSPISRSSASSSSSVSVASLPRESTSKMNEEPLATVSVDAASTQAPANASTTTLADSGDNIASIITEQTLTSEPSSLGPSPSPSSSPSSLPSSSPSPSPSPPPPRPISTTPYRTPSPLHSRMSTSSQRTISSLSNKAITVDLRWTLIADLFLISISDSVYDARARVLLKTVGRHLGLEWQEIVLFEKSIMKQLQQQAAVTSDGLLKPDTKSRNDESRK
ncbi:hypothetical protein BGZ52_011525, partial [Haplosporangium bisporale]